ncbi:MAG: hypothetical protein ABFC42_09340 [Sulfuricella sp.]
MTALPSNRYRDPLDIILDEEARTCKGCKHDKGEMVFGKRTFECAIKRKSKNSKCYEETHGITCNGGR